MVLFVAIATVTDGFEIGGILQDRRVVPNHIKKFVVAQHKHRVVTPSAVLYLVRFCLFEK